VFTSIPTRATNCPTRQRFCEFVLSVPPGPYVLVPPTVSTRHDPEAVMVAVCDGVRNTPVLTQNVSDGTRTVRVPYVASAAMDTKGSNSPSMGDCAAPSEGNATTKTELSARRRPPQ